MRRVALMLCMNVAMVVILVGCGDGNNSNNQDVVQIQPSTHVEDEAEVQGDVGIDDTVDSNISGNADSTNNGYSDSANNVSNTNSGANNTTANYITETQAKEIALNHAGVKEADTKYLVVKFEYDDGIAEYEVEWDVDRVEYEYEIDAITGEIRGFSKDLD